MSWEKWVVLGLIAYSSLVTIMFIGKPRKPVTPGVAVAVLLINAGLCALVVLA